MTTERVMYQRIETPIDVVLPVHTVNHVNPAPQTGNLCSRCVRKLRSMDCIPILISLGFIGAGIYIFWKAGVF